VGVEAVEDGLIVPLFVVMVTCCCMLTVCLLFGILVFLLLCYKAMSLFIRRGYQIMYVRNLDRAISDMFTS
jgi:hypothetical protein